MKKTLLFAFGMIIAVLVSSCSSSEKLTRAERYAQMYEEKPVTLLIMPPINKTTHVEAKELFYTSMSKPLIDAGYYVISPIMALDIMKAESAYDSELFVDADLRIFKSYFGADAVVFTEIGKWEKKGIGIQTNIVCTIKSTTTNKVLFDRQCDLFLNLTPTNYSGGTTVADLLTAVVKTAATDPIVAARKANAVIFNDIPYGKYHPLYLEDMEKLSKPREVKTEVK